MSSECRRLDLQSSALAQSITGMMGFRLGMHRKTANADGVRITTATGQRVRLDKVSVHRGDQTEADRESGIADHQDDPLVTRPLHVHVVNADDKVTDTNTCQLPMSHAHNHTRTALCDRSFAVAGPRIWNSLPATIRDPTLSAGTFAAQHY